MEFVVLDTETTGLSPDKGSCIIEVAAVVVRNWEVQTEETYSELINPGRPIDPFITRLTGITNSMVRGKRNLFPVVRDFLSFLGDRTVVIQNASFDLRFLQHSCHQCDIEPFRNPYIDTIHLSRALFRGRHNLDEILRRLGIHAVDRHRALGDAIATAHAFVAMSQKIGYTNLWRWVRIP